jgi:flagellar M-ring protein FliF
MPPAKAAPWMNSARHLGESQLETLKSVGTLVEDNPKQAALIVRDWLNNAA